MADCYSIAAADAALAAALLVYYTSSQVDAPHGKRAGHADAGRHHSRAAGLLHLGASGRPVGRLPHGTPTLGEVLLEPTLTTLGNFLVRSNSQSSVASANFTVGGFQLQGYAMTERLRLEHCALTPGRRYSFGCRRRLGTASNLVMYVSTADNDYVGITGTFLGPRRESGARRAWTSRCRRAELRSCTSERVDRRAGALSAQKAWKSEAGSAASVWSLEPTL